MDEAEDEVWINYWAKWQDGHRNEPREAWFFSRRNTPSGWAEFEPSEELRAVLHLLGDGSETYQIEWDLFESLGYKRVGRHKL